MRLKKKIFTKLNEDFNCDHCGCEVKKLTNGFCRNHCPKCLYSKHMDVNPGDRDAGCQGLMQPTRIEQEGRRGYVVIHKCLKCGDIRRNRLALEDKNQPDDMNTVLAIMKKYVESV